MEFIVTNRKMENERVSYKVLFLGIKALELVDMP